jgi:hypothetical protein
MAEVIEALRLRLSALETQAQRFDRIAQERAAEPGAPLTVERRVRPFPSLLRERDRLDARFADADRSGRPGSVGANSCRSKRSYDAASLGVREPGLGAFTFVLHSHLPYCRLAGRWPHGEEWIHEAAAETYVPLLNALYDLRDEGINFKLTISLTPILSEQLADADIREHFIRYLEDEILAAQRDIPRFGEEENAHLEYLATFYRDYYVGIRDSS